jgi:hypothetical protein
MFVEKDLKNLFESLTWHDYRYQNCPSNLLPRTSTRHDSTTGEMNINGVRDVCFRDITSGLFINFSRVYT